MYINIDNDSVILPKKIPNIIADKTFEILESLFFHNLAAGNITNQQYTR